MFKILGHITKNLR